MKNWLFVLLTVLVITSYQAKAKNDLEISSHTIESKQANASLKFKVALPWGYDKNKAYPVLYTTAGGSRFNSLTYQLDWLSHVAMGPMPQFIVVNVPQVTVPSDMHPKFVAASGIANELQLTVLAQEVMPYIEEHFLTQGFNLLEGYSSNGNFVLHTFLTKRALFDGYLVHSPVLELDKSGLVGKLSNLETKNLENTPPLYLSLGPFTGNKPLYEKISSHLNHHPAFKFEDLSQHNFLSVATISMVNSAEWLFADLSPDVGEFVEGGIASVKRYYKKLTLKYKKAMDSSDTLINLSFYYANHDNKNKALDTISTLVNEHPDNVYYLTRKALIHKKIGQLEESKQSFTIAEDLATKANNQDALSYIKGELAKL